MSQISGVTDKPSAYLSPPIIGILLTIVISLGYLYAAYWDDIKRYITVSGVSKSNRYTISWVDDTDIEYIKMILPEDTLDQVAESISDKKFISDPHSPMQSDILLASSDRNYGTNLPWDKDVKPCEILKNTDRDLYANVQDAKSITIY
jgi:uncharacterized protein YlbG (UPF0298 family)